MRSDLLPGTRRATGSVPAPGRARRPDAVTNLQGAIGNRAVAQLLREARVLARDPKPKQPSTFSDAGLSTTSRVDGKTPALIQAALAESALLAPYLKGKFPANAITAEKFVIEDTDSDFNYHFREWAGIKDNLSDKQLAEQLRDYGGYFDRPRHTIHLRPRASLGHAVHEAMHKVSAAAFLFWGSFVDEGVTQYFADLLLGEQTLAKVKDHNYGPQLACAEKLVAAVGRDAVARAYFQGGAELLNAVTKKLGIDSKELKRLIDSGKLCERL